MKAMNSGPVPADADDDGMPDEFVDYAKAGEQRPRPAAILLSPR